MGVCMRNFLLVVFSLSFTVLSSYGCTETPLFKLQISYKGSCEWGENSGTIFAWTLEDGKSVLRPVQYILDNYRDEYEDYLKKKYVSVNEQQLE